MIMNFRKKFWEAIVWILFMMLTANAPAVAVEYEEFRHHAHGVEQDEIAVHGKDGGKSDSGAIAGWLLALANFPVATSILLKSIGKVSQGSSLRETLKRINRNQKKLLMGLHYWLNPIALGMALFHYANAECESTFFPELGLIMMILVFILGLMLMFKFAMKPMGRIIFKLHTSPISLAIVLSILLIGHSMVD